MTRLKTRVQLAAAGLIAVGLLSVSACGITDELLSPQQPGTITAEAIATAGPAGAEALRIGALGQMKQWAGAADPTRMSDVLTDVWKASDTFQQNNETDQRTVSLNNSIVAGGFASAQNSRGRFRDAIVALSVVSPPVSG